MPGLLRRFARSPEAKRRLRYFTAAVFGLMAAVSWWSIYAEGSSTARLLTAIASSAVAVIEVFFPKRKRLRARNGNTPTERP